MSAIVEPTRHKLSIDEYERLFTAGVLPEDSRVELIEGDLIDMPPVGTGHASVSIRLNRLLVRRAGDDAIVSVANPLRLPPWSMPQADFLLLEPRPDDYASALPDAGSVLLAVEVADSSLRYDRVTKARVYASPGVHEYWVIEVGARRLHRHRDPLASEGRYASVESFDAPFTISVAELPQVSLASDEIWL
ncbi:MAG TPA: Uma2 family endonuclease [Burkholderiaceae bacterium]|nr:Uma2 family endonuclease [Burkholderiaceae bacterium]